MNVDHRRRDLRLRAAVLSCFEVPWLGVHDPDDDAVERLLLEDSVRVIGADGRGYWALDELLRRDVARSASLADLLAAWRAWTGDRRTSASGRSAPASRTTCRHCPNSTSTSCGRSSGR